MGGSFTVGAFPPPLEEPSSNKLFPELMRAVFELEVELAPWRKSSTIAINRKAQFVPHLVRRGDVSRLLVSRGDVVRLQNASWNERLMPKTHE